MAYEVKDRNDNLIGSGFASVDDAKRAVPQVVEWRQDESRPMGWNGWLTGLGSSDPAAFSGPDYLVTFVPVRMT